MAGQAMPRHSLPLVTVMVEATETFREAALASQGF
jgi:hypothetical protein